VTGFDVIVKIGQKKACKWVAVGCMMSLVENSGTPAKGFRQHKNHKNIKNLTFKPKGQF
jgi:hypothetical protein